MLCRPKVEVLYITVGMMKILVAYYYDQELTARTQHTISPGSHLCGRCTGTAAHSLKRAAVPAFPTRKNALTFL